MFKKILFPTDFSDASQKAVKYIKQLKGAGAQEVIILHVIDEKELLVLSRASDQYLQITACPIRPSRTPNPVLSERLLGSPLPAVSTL